MLDDILLQVNKPARYIGEEWNISRKDFTKANIRFALCFPDLYEVGMSNLGMRIIYGILNEITDTCCERFFSPDIDMGSLLKEKNLEILSLESKRRLREFDIIGFSLASELGFTNVLNILELGVIPLEESLRDNTYPLVIGGGPCALNPEPMHKFFDLFVIGEAEDVIGRLIYIYRKYKEPYKTSKVTKEDLLSKFAGIPGVYVPSFYEVRYNSEGTIEEFRPKAKGAPLKVKKTFVKDLDLSFSPLMWLVPYIQTIHDRIALEVMRGCPNRCRFCQGRAQYFPLRVRNIENILNLAAQTYKHTGYEEISLCGLSVSDYPQIEDLLIKLTDLFKHKAVSLSLPSVKAKEIVGSLSSVIAKTKKTSLTFAPETGTERLRKIIGKDFNEQDFFKVIEQAYLSGYRHTKLYFMIGLPLERNDDLDAIVDLSVRVSELRRRIKKFPAQVNISINTFIPKPHTPFQWFKMEEPDAIRYKEDYIRNKVKKYLPGGRQERLVLKFHNRYMSFLECVLSRGDRRLSEVILLAFKRGAQFDAWGNHFNFDLWCSAFKEAGIEAHSYLRQIQQDELLPWDFLDVGISKESLLSEFNKTIA